MLDRLSIRAKLTAAFAAAMVVVLVFAGLFVDLRVGSDLSSTIDDALQSRTNTLVGLVAAEDKPPELQNGRFVGGEEGFTQILTPNGAVVESTLAPGPVRPSPRPRRSAPPAGSSRSTAAPSRGWRARRGSSPVPPAPATAPTSSWPEPPPTIGARPWPACRERS